jgi:hypothetical protein
MFAAGSSRCGLHFPRRMRILLDIDLHPTRINSNFPVPTLDHPLPGQTAVT